MAELFTSLPRHLYCHVERRFISRPVFGDPHKDTDPRLLRCTWFGLTSIPGRAWGFTIMLECGAVYSQVPPHAIVFTANLELLPLIETGSPPVWPLERAQVWNCFGTQFALHEYDALADLRVRVRWPDDATGAGRYLFTAQHYGDGYSETPEQAKQFHFIALDQGRLTALPANNVLFVDPSFTTPNANWPTWLKRQTELYTCE